MKHNMNNKGNNKRINENKVINTMNPMSNKNLTKGYKDIRE